MADYPKKVKLVRDATGFYKAQVSVYRPDGRIVVAYGPADNKEALAKTIDEAQKSAEAFDAAEHDLTHAMAMKEAKAQRGK